ncbi:DUF4360 domain-containing protein [Polyangium aurulentum]|uniref:DUF4360 domain-containing protein n=1 Tax=Polyangium aurulentum TaxID=2567896 RepID=UPI0010ADE3A1|nr:DUF4360 domain-containing protein [Polyangium aurulentum]UQA58836.1 DUF4360 domain-containing protein [Polyangium aurulentum]
MKNPIAAALPALAPALLAPAGPWSLDLDDLVAPPDASVAALDSVDPPADPPVALRDVVLAGNGCRGAGAAAAAISEGGNAIVVDFDALSADTTTGPPKQSRSCTLVGTLAPPPGHRVAVTGVSALGDANLRAGASARIIVRHFQPGSPSFGAANRIFRGPYRGAAALSFKDESPTWSGCGASQRVVVTTTIFLDAGGARAGGRAGIGELDVDFTVQPCM